MKTIRIGDKKIGNNESVFIMGEIASSHEGSLELAKKMLKAGVETGVDAIKFQIFSAEELLVPEHPKYESFKEIELKEEEWIELSEYSKNFSIMIIADVFDEWSADLADSLEVTAFKIHSTNLSNPHMLKHVAKKEKPIFLATGGSTTKEIKAAIEIVKRNGTEDIILMHGYQGFPSRLENTNLKLIQTLRNKFNLEVGIADHVAAGTDMCIIAPLLAIAFGACVIEKHFTLDRSLKGVDYHSALNPVELKDFVGKVRQAEIAIGSGISEISEEEEEYRKLMKKNIVARVNIIKETMIERDMLAFKRASGGLSPAETEKIIGKKTKKDIKENEIISLEMVE